MTDYKKLVEALRHLSTGRCDDLHGCEPCAIYETCLTRCVLDAADAIEALQAEVYALEETLKAVQKNSGINFRMWEEAQAEVERLKKEKKELVADRPEMEEVNGRWEWRKPNGEVLMPKRGEWIWKHRHHGGFKTAKGKCECGRDVYAQIDERYETDDPYCPFCGVMNDSIHLNYCPNCGSNMEVQDDKA